jgi:hypothetical protein
MVTVWLAPSMLMRPVCCTSPAVYGDGGMKKSSLLMALPWAVITEIRPDPVPLGTVVAIEVAVAEFTVVRAILNRVSFPPRLVLKLVPVTVTAVPGVPIAGVNPVIVGAPVEEVTVKTELLAAEPLGEVTAMNPVVAPAGTVVTIFVVVEEVTEAVTPLNATVFWLGVALNPVPKIVTIVPTAPLFGVNSITDTTDDAWRVIERRLPTAS